MLTILTARVFLPVVRAGVFVAALALCACSSLRTSHLYPELRDVPAPPSTSPQAERERIIKELERERESPGPVRQPAVPPLPPKLDQSSSLETLIVCADTPVVSPAVPPLRGTLHGNWHPPAGMVARPGRAPVAGTGITGAIAAVRPDPRGALVLGFASGAATLAADDLASLREAVTDFVLQGGTTVHVKARGGAPMAGALVPHRPLASLSLGFARATAIVNALIASGISPNHIKISAQGDEDVPAVAAQDWSKAGPDGAIVIFEPVKP